MNRPVRIGQFPANRHRPFAVIVLLLALIAVVAVAAPAQAHPRPSPGAGPDGCARHDTAVTLAPDRTTEPSYRVAGWLCMPRGGTRTVQLLIAGFTYSHTYWTGISRTTSWTADALQHGDAVYLIDRVGTGASDRPPADQVTVSSEAQVVHQVVSALRDGRIGRFRQVVGVGHSYGSIVLAAEAAVHHDLDALVFTGKLFDYNQPGLQAFQSSLYPASADPKFVRARIPAGYVTTPPASRAGFFLNTATAAPGAASWQEATKDVGTSGELATMKPDTYLADSRRITVPVLLIVGSRDALFCNTNLRCDTGTQLCQRVHGKYAPGTPVAATALPGAGHAIDLHRNAPEAFTAAHLWITRAVTDTGQRSAVTNCHT